MSLNRRRPKVEVKAPKPPKKKRQYDVFNWLNKFLPLDKIFGEKVPGQEERVPVKYFYYVAWVVALLVSYEWLGYKSEQYVRNSIKLQKEVDNLRAEYTSIHADYMKSGKQSVVIEKVKDIGLEENLTPPKKIIIKTDD
ncbi:FtsL-like putative cell division protein [Dyadobacter tibetensis]|uniref:FtsL-like putative cell division protein n=1 Tax=Dyadobacter tibetensis TaxID=1211851 RepID=UPI0004700FF4|nr:FtsL-like putative cell division protein [Dyadobacter tibetensis]